MFKNESTNVKKYTYNFIMCAFLLYCLTCVCIQSYFSTHINKFIIYNSSVILNSLECENIRYDISIYNYIIEIITIIVLVLCVINTEIQRPKLILILIVLMSLIFFTFLTFLIIHYAYDYDCINNYYIYNYIPIGIYVSMYIIYISCIFIYILEFLRLRILNPEF